MQIPKEIDQVLTEEVLAELPSTRCHRFIEATRDIDSSWVTIRVKNIQDLDIVFRILPDGSLAGRKNAIRRGLMEHVEPG